MINEVTLIGNVGADPTIRCFENGNSVAKFRLVTTERYKDKDGNTRELNEWHTVEAWGKPASIIDQYVRKGDRLYVKGSIHYEEYSDRDNIKRTQTIIRLQGVKLLTPRTKEEQAPPQVEQLKKELGLTAEQQQAQPRQQELGGMPEPPKVPMPPLPDIEDLPF